MNEVTLEEWTSHYHETEEMEQLFCAQSDALKRTHQSGYYVSDFNLSQVLVREENRKKYILFKNVERLPKGEEEFYRHKNVKTECFQEVGIYCSMLSDMNVSFTPSFLKENFDRFSPFIPEAEFAFYKKVFVYDAMIYLCDYVKKSREKELTQLENQLKEESGGRSFNKSTPQGRASTQEDKEMLQNGVENSSQSAFVYTFVLLFVVFSLSLLIPIFAWVFGTLS